MDDIKLFAEKGKELEALILLSDRRQHGSKSNVATHTITKSVISWYENLLLLLFLQ